MKLFFSIAAVALLCRAADEPLLNNDQVFVSRLASAGAINCLIIDLDSGDAFWGSAPARQEARLIHIEVKNGDAKAKFRLSKTDPVAIDREHTKLLIDNKYVRAFREHLGPKEGEKMHERLSGGRVVVWLTDANVQVMSIGGEAKKIHQKAGDVTWSGGPLTHRGENLDERAIEMIVVDLKN